MWADPDASAELEKQVAAEFGDLLTADDNKRRMWRLVYAQETNAAIRAAGVQVTMFLVNGVMLQGRVAAYDLFCMLLEREGYVQLAYKHAVSTIQPAGHVDLSGEWEGEAS